MKNLLIAIVLVSCVACQGNDTEKSGSQPVKEMSNQVVKPNLDAESELQSSPQANADSAAAAMAAKIQAMVSKGQPTVSGSYKSAGKSKKYVSETVPNTSTAASSDDSKIKSTTKINSESTSNAQAAKANVDMHQAFDGLLRKYVSSTGKVNYQALSGEASILNAYIQSFSALRVNSLPDDNAKKAFWINLYNAVTIKLILDNYPVEKITDLNGGKPWDVKQVMVDGRQLSLNQIENEILRPQFKDARIHFALNCAAKSCPPLANRAYQAGDLDRELDKHTRAFINNQEMNSIGANAVEISKIFDWYSEDFQPNVIAFLNQYNSTKIDPTADIKFKEYNWDLNN